MILGQADVFYRQKRGNAGDKILDNIFYLTPMQVVPRMEHLMEIRWVLILGCIMRN